MTGSSKPPAAGSAASIEPLDRLADRVLARITPFFQPIPPVDDATARQAAADMLFAYDCATGKELQLAAQVAVLGIGALACLSASKSVMGVAIPALLRMCDDAMKMQAMSEQLAQALKAIQYGRALGRTPRAIGVEFSEAEFNATIRFAREKVDYAHTQVEALKVAGELAAKRAGTAKPVKKAARPRDKAMDVAWIDELEVLMRTTG
jgi:hypothetical protein